MNRVEEILTGWDDHCIIAVLGNSPLLPYVDINQKIGDLLKTCFDNNKIVFLCNYQDEKAMAFCFGSKKKCISLRFGDFKYVLNKNEIIIPKNIPNNRKIYEVNIPFDPIQNLIIDVDTSNIFEYIIKKADVVVFLNKVFQNNEDVTELLSECAYSKEKKTVSLIIDTTNKYSFNMSSQNTESDKFNDYLNKVEKDYYDELNNVFMNTFSFSKDINEITVDTLCESASNLIMAFAEASRTKRLKVNMSWKDKFVALFTSNSKKTILHTSQSQIVSGNIVFEKEFKEACKLKDGFCILRYSFVDHGTVIHEANKPYKGVFGVGILNADKSFSMTGITSPIFPSGLEFVLSLMKKIIAKSKCGICWVFCCHCRCRELSKLKKETYREFPQNSSPEQWTYFSITKYLVMNTPVTFEFNYVQNVDGKFVINLMIVYENGKKIKFATIHELVKTIKEELEEDKKAFSIIKPLTNLRWKKIYPTFDTTVTPKKGLYSDELLEKLKLFNFKKQDVIDNFNIRMEQIPPADRMGKIRQLVYDAIHQVSNKSFNPSSDRMIKKSSSKNLVWV